jgi:hypothetical protein
VIGGTFSTRRRCEKCNNILIVKPERKWLLGIHRCRLKDVITTDLMDTGREVVDWIHLAQDRDQWRTHVNTLVNVRVS